MRGACSSPHNHRGTLGRRSPGPWKQPDMCLGSTWSVRPQGHGLLHSQRAFLSPPAQVTDRGWTLPSVRR